MLTLTIAGTDIAVHQMGGGTPVVLLHCSAASAKQLRPFAEALRQATGFGSVECLMPDLHGYGASASRANAVPLSLSHEAEIVAAIARRFGRPVHLVGHSYGGAAALVAAEAFPDLVRSLVLIEPVSFHLLRDGDSRDALLMEEIRRVATAVRCGVLAGDPASGMANFIDFWGGAGTWSGMTDGARDVMARHAPQVARNFWSGFNHPLRLADLRRLAVPTRLIFGSRTKAITRRVVDLIEHTLPDTSLRMVPEAGHMVPLSHPQAVAGHVAGHLALTQTETLTNAA